MAALVKDATKGDGAERIGLHTIVSGALSEGNHRMVAALEIYNKTGDRSHIDNLL